MSMKRERQFPEDEMFKNVEERMKRTKPLVMSEQESEKSLEEYKKKYMSKSSAELDHLIKIRAHELEKLKKVVLLGEQEEAFYQLKVKEAHLILQQNRRAQEQQQQQLLLQQQQQQQQQQILLDRQSEIHRILQNLQNGTAPDDDNNNNNPVSSSSPPYNENNTHDRNTHSRPSTKQHSKHKSGRNNDNYNRRDYRRDHNHDHK